MQQEIHTYDKVYKNSLEYFGGDELATKVFIDKYALRDKNQELVELSPDDTHKRIAKELARIEKKKFKEPMSFDEIFSYLDHFKKIVPQGSLLYGIGNKYQYVTLSNCYLIDPPLDSYAGILFSDEQLVQISKRRGGTGLDISNLRPDGSATSNAAKTSSGIISFMERYSNSIREVGQHGRRGALLISISVHHPEVLKFARIKRDLKKVTGANISIRLSDEFLNAVDKDKEYELRWPIDSKEPKISRMVNARSVWRQIIEGAHAVGEPGLLFWDNIIKESPADCYAKFGFTTRGTNPCGEVPLSPLDSCRLLLLNAYGYVKDPFTDNAKFDYDEFYHDAQIAQRFMDDIIDLELECIDRIIKKVKSDPEPDNIKQREMNLWIKIRDVCETGRRTGTGITGLGDVMAALGIQYASTKSIKVADKIYKTLKLGCYRSSVDMAKELGPFKVWDHKLEKDNPFLNRIKEQDPELYKDMKKYGRRNISLLTSSPAGSVSILVQTTSAFEPLFKIWYMRRKKVNPKDKNVRVDFVDQNGDSWQNFMVFHPKVEVWKEVTGKTNTEESPWFGSCANEIDWTNRVSLQATATKHIDHSISSTINLPEDVSVETVAEIYEKAWKSGCKGVTVYRNKSRTGVLVDAEDCPECHRNSGKITKLDAPKRPKSLPCKIHHVTVKGEAYLVLVGLMNNDPYEVFAMKNGQIPKSITSGSLKKIKRGHYSLLTKKEDHNIENVMAESGELEEAITRLVSASLRHGADIEFIVHQLEKTKTSDVFGSFEKAIARSLKKYIPDGTKVSGETCSSCGSDEIQRREGCIYCMSCGFSLCS